MEIIVVVKIRNWKFVRDDCIPEDMFNCSVEVWGGEYDISTPFSVQVDRRSGKYRFSSNDGSSSSYSSWRDLKEISDKLRPEVSEFDWNFDLQ